MTPAPGLGELARWHSALQQPPPPPELDVEAVEQLMAAALGAQGGVAMGMGAAYMLDWLCAIVWLFSAARKSSSTACTGWTGTRWRWTWPSCPSGW